MTELQSGPNQTPAHPMRSDIVLAGVVGAVSLAVFIGRAVVEELPHDEAFWSFVFPVAAALPLAYRRVRPVLALIAIVAAVVVYLLFFDEPGPMVIPVWIGLYSVALNGDRRTSIVVAVLAAILVSVAALTLGPEAESPSAVALAVAVMLTIIPLLIGDAVRSRRALIAATDERVRLVEASAVNQARQQVLDERVRIARDLHDVVAHSIATINVQSGVAALVIDEDPKAAKEALTEIKASSKSALGELRSMLGVLRDSDEEIVPLAPSPGLRDIATLIERYSGSISYEEIGGSTVEVDPVIELVAYRIVQESLTNVMKHALNAAVQVWLEYGDESLVIKVSDDGGQSTPESDGGGLGLVGLTERARAVGGSLTAAPRFDGGFVVEAALPYTPTTGVAVEASEARTP